MYRGEHKYEHNHTTSNENRFKGGKFVWNGAHRSIKWVLESTEGSTWRGKKLQARVQENEYWT
jgi:hypothetical protein